jgi:hypothetical protein
MNKPTHFSAQVPFSGFYETSHDQRIDEAEEQMFSGDDGEIVSSVAYEAFWSNLNYGSVHEKYAKAYVAALAHVLKIPLDYEEMVSPREYNFTTDRLFARISRSDFAKMLRAVRGKRLNEEALDRFTSRSGFISFYPNSVSRWGRIPKDANVNLEWRGSQCPYLHVTVEHQRPGSGPSASDHDWATKLDDALA